MSAPLFLYPRRVFVDKKHQKERKKDRRKEKKKERIKTQLNFGIAIGPDVICDMEDEGRIAVEFLFPLIQF